MGYSAEFHARLARDLSISYMATSTPVGAVFLRVFKEEFGKDIRFRPGLPGHSICPGSFMNEYVVGGYNTLNLSQHPSKVCNPLHSAT